ncbi:MAG: tetratricopeptide repeat protein [Planctomycetes bacterium]|nr:tetratricopeptide repeat protein [Planctomycetota bacterium]
MDLSKHLEKAAEAVRRRNYGFAVGLYSQLLSLQPDNGAARAGLREALFKKAEAKPPSKLFALLGGGVSLLLGRLLRLLRQHGAAAGSFERYLRLDPLDESANLALAASLERAGHRQSALAVYRAYAEHEPRCLVASREAGRLLYEAGELDTALQMYEQALKVDPRDQEALRARKNLAAEGALKRTGLDTAKHSRELLKDVDKHKALERASRRQLSPEEIDEELRDLEAKLAEDAQDVAALTRMAQLHEMRRDHRAALDCAESALALRPNDAELAARAGELRIRVQEGIVADARARGDESAAKAAGRVLGDMRVGEFRRRVERQPSDLGLRFELGAALFDVGQLDGAIAELQQAVKDPRRQADARYLLGRAFRAKGLGELARGQLEQALQSSGGSSSSSSSVSTMTDRAKEVLYELGGLAEDAGDSAGALEHYSKILEQDFGFRDVAKKVESLRGAS